MKKKLYQLKEIMMLRNSLVYILFLYIFFSCNKEKKSTKYIFYEDNILSDEVNLLNDSIRHGYSFTYFSNGRVKNRFHFFYGNYSGHQNSFNLNGILIESVPFKNGLMNGFAKWYNNQGTIQEISKWKNGTQFGDAYYFYANGKLATYNCIDSDSTNMYVINFDSSSSQINYESGHLFSHKVLKTNIGLNKIKLSIIVPNPPKRKIKIGYGLSFKNNEFKYQYINHNNNVAEFIVDKKNKKVLIFGELFNNKNCLLMTDTIEFKID